MQIDRVDAVVIGAGVIGVAVARALALQGRDVLVLEAEAHIAEHASSRNSEVIHAGLYYPPGTFKARYCIEGKAHLYAYCAQYQVPHRRIGKLVVATQAAQVEKLEQIAANAAACGMPDLQWLDSQQARTLEPHVICAGALFSPSTGIIDSHSFMLSLQGQAEHAGATFVFNSAVEQIELNANGIHRLWVHSTADPDEVTILDAALIVNAAGLFAPTLAQRMLGFDAQLVPAHGYAKGHYFSLTGKSPFNHLIYPVPEQGGLGIHVTLDMGGQARFGPDVTWVDSVDYSFDEQRKHAFVHAITQYYPALNGDLLQPSYTGIRAKIGARGDTQDFQIWGPDDHGIPGLVQLFGIESPGLTSALPIAEHVARLAHS